MNMINLSQDIRNGLSFKADSSFVGIDKFDLILLEDDYYFNKNKIKIRGNIKFLDKEIKESSVLKLFSEYSEKYENVLLILDKLTVVNMHIYLDLFANITVINLFTGISSKSQKITIEYQDVTIMNQHGFKVVEPYDMETFNYYLENNNIGSISNNKLYIKLTSSYCPYKIGLEDQIKNIGGVLSLAGCGFHGNKATVFFIGAHAYMGVNAINELKQEGKEYDVFLLSEYDFVIGESIKNSIMITQKVIIFIDQYKSQLLEKQIKNKFMKTGLKEVEIYFVNPAYDKVFTVMADYQFEQAEFDENHIKENLLRITG